MIHGIVTVPSECMLPDPYLCPERSPVILAVLSKQPTTNPPFVRRSGDN